MPGKKRWTRPKRRGFKACDPFCRDKIRVALYNRPNGPFMGRIIPGKTFLSGLDHKCFSRTGRIKKGYRNIPIDIEREFEIEKRQIQEIQSMINYKANKKKTKKRKQSKNSSSMNIDLDAKEQKTETVTEMKSKSETKKKSETNALNSELKEDTNDSTANEPAVISEKQKKKEKHELQSIDELKRLPTETFAQFVYRCQKTQKHALNELKFGKMNKRKLLLKERKQMLLKKKIMSTEIKKKVKKQEESPSKIMKRIERKQMLRIRYLTKKYEHPERIIFGERNDEPPKNLFDFGRKLFKKYKNDNNINFNALSFVGSSADHTQEMDESQNRTENLKLQRIKRNYQQMKEQRRGIAKKQRKMKQKQWRKANVW